MPVHRRAAHGGARAQPRRRASSTPSGPIATATCRSGACVGVQKEAVLAATPLDRHRRGDRRRARRRVPNAIVLPSWVVSRGVRTCPAVPIRASRWATRVRDNAFYQAWDAISRDRDIVHGVDRRARDGHGRLRRVLRQRRHPTGGGHCVADDESVSADDLMIVNAARELADGRRVLRRHRAAVDRRQPGPAARTPPECVLVYESGCIGSKPTQPAAVDRRRRAGRDADAVVSVPEIFAYWLQAGRIDVGFLGGAQLDRYGNINSTVIGDYEHPTTRLPGAGGAPEIAASAGEVMVIMRQRPSRVRRALRLPHVDRLRRRPGRPRTARAARPRARRSSSPTSAILRPDPETCELVLDRPASRRHRRAGDRGDRLAAAARRRRLGDTDRADAESELDAALRRP